MRNVPANFNELLLLSLHKIRIRKKHVPADSDRIAKCFMRNKSWHLRSFNRPTLDETATQDYKTVSTILLIGSQRRRWRHCRLYNFVLILND